MRLFVEPRLEALSVDFLMTCYGIEDTRVVTEQTPFTQACTVYKKCSEY